MGWLVCALGKPSFVYHAHYQQHLDFFFCYLLLFLTHTSNTGGSLIIHHAPKGLLVNICTEQYKTSNILCLVWYYRHIIAPLLSQCSRLYIYMGQYCSTSNYCLDVKMCWQKYIKRVFIHFSKSFRIILATTSSTMPTPFRLWSSFLCQTFLVSNGKVR